MGLKTPIIQYNLRERGRRYRGKDRNFNIKAIYDAVNSPECQERVANRDMLGFFGHWPRIRFGIDPKEGGIVDGSASAVEPAIVTTMLKAHPDGTIEHQTEFLDTDPGQIAQRMYMSKVGGFSSAIDPNKPAFWGFDYVNEPNYTSNRGYVLDSAGMSYDDVFLAEQAEQQQAILALLDSANNARDMALEAMERLQAENEELLSILASRGFSESVLDSATLTPVTVPISGAQSILNDVQSFRSLGALPSVQRPEEAAVIDDTVYARLLNRVRGV